MPAIRLSPRDSWFRRFLASLSRRGTMHSAANSAERFVTGCITSLPSFCPDSCSRNRRSNISRSERKLGGIDGAYFKLLSESLLVHLALPPPPTVSQQPPVYSGSSRILPFQAAGYWTSFAARNAAGQFAKRSRTRSHQLPANSSMLFLIFLRWSKRRGGGRFAWLMH